MGNESLSWDEYRKVIHSQNVHNAIFNFSQDPTEDGAVIVAEEIHKALPCAPQLENSANQSTADIIRMIADRLEAEEGKSADAGYMWDAAECAEFIREEAEKLRGAEQPCQHKNYDFEKHGRHCWDCGARMVDFGD